MSAIVGRQKIISDYHSCIGWVKHRKGSNLPGESGGRERLGIHGQFHEAYIEKRMQLNTYTAHIIGLPFLMFLSGCLDFENDS